MLQADKIGARSMALVAVCIAAVLIAGCRERQSPEAEFIKLIETGLFRTDGASVMAMGIPVARTWISRAEKEGIDLFASYKRHLGNVRIRHAFAYLLLVDENLDYVDYGNTHRKELADCGEFRAWGFVLSEEQSGLSQEFQSELMSVLAELDLPYARLVVGKDHLASGREVEGIQTLLGVMRTGVPWASEAYKATMELPDGPRRKLLLPHVEAGTAEGAHAAYILAQSETSRPMAVKRLEEMKRSDDPSAREASTQMLDWLQQE